MHFDLVDAVVERTADRIVTLKHVTAAEEYLQDHFPGFPVLPGVMMLEAMVQAARRLVEPTDAAVPMVLGQVRALKYGRFVPPGSTLRVTVTVHKRESDGSVDLRGEAALLEPTVASAGGASDDPAASGTAGATAVSGRFVLRPARTS